MSPLLRLAFSSVFIILLNVAMAEKHVAMAEKTDTLRNKATYVIELNPISLVFY